MLPNSQNANYPKPSLHSCVEGANTPSYSPRHPTGGFVTWEAFAKINLYLDVANKRPDGYHNIVSILQSVDLSDVLTIGYSSPDEKEYTAIGDIRLFVEGTDSVLANLPKDETNLAVRAAQHMMKMAGVEQPIYIDLLKRIPIGAGLAGGSSDCAAALLGANELFGLNLELSELIKIGLEFGADVPFCLFGGTALGEGVGERLTAMPNHPECAILVVNPGIHISTRDMFPKLNLGPTRPRPQIPIQDIYSAVINTNLHGIISSVYNVFTSIASEEYPVISEIIADIINLGAIGAGMTGTGGTVFGYFEDKDEATLAYQMMKNSYPDTFLTKPVARKE